MEFVEPIREREKIEVVKKILKRKSMRNFLLFLIGINSGLRISDILKLRVCDVVNKNYIEIKEQKTGKLKKVPITNSFKENLIEFIFDKSPEEYLFTGKCKDRPISRIQAYRIINGACQKAGITTHIGTHTMRKTFGYHFYKKNKDVALLQTIFNHSTPAVTLKYIGINQDIIDSSLNSFAL